MYVDIDDGIDIDFEALEDADLSEDPHTLRVLAVLQRAHEAGLVFGGSADLVDPSGWTKGTLPAVAQLIADELHSDTVTTSVPVKPPRRPSPTQ